MSWQLVLLNRYLRWIEKPALARHAPERLRRSFETNAKIYFHGPRGAVFRRDRLSNVPVQWAVARQAHRPETILYLHGGGYVFGSSDTHRAMAATLSDLSGMAVCLPDYRLAPEHPFPAQIEDALAVYRAISASGEVVLGGDSAGGGLALALLHEVRRHGLRPPLGCFAFSPIVDMTFSSPSVQENAESDNVLVADRIDEMLGMYLREKEPEDPRASPLFGAFSGSPPVWLTAGDTELLRDDAVRMGEILDRQGVDVCVTIKPDHPHVWPLFHNVLPEGKATLREVAHWIRSLSPPAAGS